MLDALFQRYDDQTRKLRIVESLLSFRSEDVTLILSLLCDRDTLDFKKKKTQLDFVEKYISKTYEKTRNTIKTTLLQLVSKK